VAQNERYNFGLLAFLLFGITAIQFIRNQLLEIAILDGIIIDGSTVDALWYYLIASVIDAGAIYLIAANPGWRVKGASLPIMWCLISACVLHALGFIYWKNYQELALYGDASRFLLALEYVFLGIGGARVIRGSRDTGRPGADFAYPSDSRTVGDSRPDDYRSR